MNHKLQAFVGRPVAPAPDVDVREALIFHHGLHRGEDEIISGGDAGGALAKSQQLIDGVVKLALYKGTASPIGRYSPSSLYNEELSSMDVAGGFDQKDSAGFIRINALRLMAHRLITRRER